ncbi:MAG: hypothetical protein J0J15_20285 [Mesorhizobium sp.]|nr:hypothetical protein [Mesorhizobium sp.]
MFARPWRIREDGASLRGIFTKIQQRNPVNAPSHAANSKPAVLSPPSRGSFWRKNHFRPEIGNTAQAVIGKPRQTLGFVL